MSLYLIFALGPSLSTVVFSFTNVSGIPGTPWKWVGFDNYTEFLTGPAARDNWAAVERTLEFCAAVTLIQNALGLLVAVTLNRRLRVHLVFLGLFFIPAILSYTLNSPL